MPKWNCCFLLSICSSAGLVLGRWLQRPRHYCESVKAVTLDFNDTKWRCFTQHFHLLTLHWQIPRCHCSVFLLLEFHRWENSFSSPGCNPCLEKSKQVGHFFVPPLSLRLWQWPAVLQSSRIILCSLTGNEEESSASSCAFSVLKWKQIVQKVLSKCHQPSLPMSSWLPRGSSSCWGSCLILRG